MNGQLSASTSAFPALRDVRVIDAMHPALITCSPESSVRTIARMMSTYRVHAILVNAHDAAGSWGIVSDADLLRASEEGDIDAQQARTVASQPVATIASSEALSVAAATMVEHDVSHLIVLEARSGRPIGVLSTLDVARALAGFPEHHPPREHQ